MNWLLQLLVNAVALLIIGHFFESFVVDGYTAALIASLILALVNLIVKPILVILTLPITIVTLGLFMIVINAITLMITSSLTGDFFQVNGFLMAIIGGVILGLLSSIIQSFVVDPLTKRS